MIDFMNCSLDRSDEYREFILSHESAVQTEKAAWMEKAKAGERIIPYCESWPEDEPNRDPQVYFEFVDEENNIYVDFFDRDTQLWVDSYRFKDHQLSWTINIDKAAIDYYRKEVPPS